jgi:ATP-dependent RNA helicase DeaD
VKDDEKSAIEELLARHRPEQIAAALIRLHQAQKPAPEELLDAAPVADPQKPSRDDFRDSVWISLSVGQDMSAEARWILPMLCGRGNITRRNIGAIKIHKNETHVELSADCVDRFFKAVGDGGKIEKDIVVTRIQGTPGASRGSYVAPQKARKTYHDRKPYASKTGGAEKPDRPFKKKTDGRKPYAAKLGEGKKPKGSSR